MTSILELDEAQGLTAEMVEEYLTQKRWFLRQIDTGCYWVDPDGGESATMADGWWLWRASLLESVADVEGRSIQAVLREMNPRMRRGRPSLAAIRECEYWLVRDVETGEVELHNSTASSKYIRSILGSPDFPQWEYWPCDARGNKVRWPTDKHGAML